MLIAVVLMSIWALWLARKPGAPPLLRHIPWVLAATWAVCFGGTLLGLLRAFRATGSAPPEMKAQILSNGIAVAMWMTAAMLVPLLAAFGVLLWASFQRRAAADPT